MKKIVYRFWLKPVIYVGKVYVGGIVMGQVLERSHVRAVASSICPHEQQAQYTWRGLLLYQRKEWITFVVSVGFQIPAMDSDPEGM